MDFASETCSVPLVLLDTSNPGVKSITAALVAAALTGAEPLAEWCLPPQPALGVPQCKHAAQLNLDILWE